MQVAKIIDCSLILQTFQTHISAIGLTACWCNDDKSACQNARRNRSWIFSDVENVMKRNAAMTGRIPFPRNLAAKLSRRCQVAMMYSDACVVVQSKSRSAGRISPHGILTKIRVRLLTENSNQPQ